MIDTMYECFAKTERRILSFASASLEAFKDLGVNTFAGEPIEEAKQTFDAALETLDYQDDQKGAESLLNENVSSLEHKIKEEAAFDEKY